MENLLECVIDSAFDGIMALNRYETVKMKLWILNGFLPIKMPQISWALRFRN